MLAYIHVYGVRRYFSCKGPQIKGPIQNITALPHFLQKQNNPEEKTPRSLFIFTNSFVVPFYAIPVRVGNLLFGFSWELLIFWQKRANCSFALFALFVFLWKQSQKMWYKFLCLVFSLIFQKEESPLLKRANSSCVRKSENCDPLILFYSRSFQKSNGSKSLL